MQKPAPTPRASGVITARAGSEYGRTQYSAAKATDAPDVPAVGNSPDAWCPASKDRGSEWLEVTFAKPVHALEVRARQNDTAGAIAKNRSYRARRNDTCVVGGC